VRLAIPAQSVQALAHSERSSGLREVQRLPVPQAQRYPVLGSTARIGERFKNFQNKVTDSGTSMKQTWFVWLVTITFDFFGAKAALRPSDRSSRGQGASTRPKAK
jgi:hypothetical protein